MIHLSERLATLIPLYQGLGQIVIDSKGRHSRTTLLTLLRYTYSNSNRLNVVIELNINGFENPKPSFYEI